MNLAAAWRSWVPDARLLPGPESSSLRPAGGRHHTLRGRAATPQGREKVRTLLEGFPQYSRYSTGCSEALHPATSSVPSYRGRGAVGLGPQADGGALTGRPR